MRTRETGGFRGLVGRVDWPVLAVVGLLSLMGLINLRSAAMHSSTAFHLVQTTWFGLGAVLVFVVTVIHTRVFVRTAYLFYGFAVALLALVAVIGVEINGSQRWLDLGVFMAQPSEVLKLAVILAVARFFDDQSHDGPYGLLELWKPFLFVGGGVLLVITQPDLGTSLVILAIFMTMVLFQGLNLQSLIALGVVVAIALPVGFTFGLKEYQRDRITAFLNKEADAQGQSWQVRQSLIAFGSGRVWGKGEGTQIQKGFVPEHQNDFIAANWGEERGFMGMLFLLAVYLAFIAAALNVARRSRDRFGIMVAVGVAALFFWHVVINIGMVTGALPVVGLTLPLMSYGGSSLLTMLFGVGLLMNITAHRGNFV